MKTNIIDRKNYSKETISCFLKSKVDDLTKGCKMGNVIKQLLLFGDVVKMQSGKIRFKF